MGYYINLEKISIDNYKEIVITANLLPSRIILKNNIEDNFKLIKKQKITNLQELFDTLKTKKKLLTFSNQSEISLDYLTILNSTLRT